MKKLIFLICSFNILFATNVQNIIKQNGCMDCHNIMGKKTAPPFLGIANRNLKLYGDDAQKHIQNSIKNGSSGKYKFFIGEKMPSYSHFTNQELHQISAWILEQFNKNKVMFMQKHKKHQGNNCN